MKKTVSQNDSLNYSQRSFIKSLLDCRNRLHTGTKLVADVLEKSKSRLAINLSCYLMKKIKELSEFLDAQLRKTEVDKENDKGSYEAKRTSTIIREEIQQLREKCAVFEEETVRIVDDERRTIEKYTEELCLGAHR
jgi:transcriptional regulator of heat shock response